MIEVLVIEEEELEPQFAIIESDQAIAMWPIVEEHFDRALEHAYDDMRPNEVLAKVLLEELYLLVVTKADQCIASFTFEKVYCRHGNGSTLHCMTLAGDDMEFWVDAFIDTWKRLALELGCNRISIKGRKGWQRFALKKGFKHQYTIMYQELEQ